MKRRSFLHGGTLAGVAAFTSQSTSPAPSAAEPSIADPAPAREFYLLRRYWLTRAQSSGCDSFLETAMLPALHRLGFADVGAFALEYGPDTPATYLLLKHAQPAKLLQLEQDLLRDEAFMAASHAFRSAPATQPAFDRVDDTLLQAFQGRPRLQLPAKGKRVFQLRTYESPSGTDFERKVEMFHSGEFGIFAQCGMPAVFYAQTVAGRSLPSLTYMLRFDNLAGLEAGWERFRNNTDWKKLSTSPHFSYEDLVSRITNLVLSPKHFSEI